MTLKIESSHFFTVEVKQFTVAVEQFTVEVEQSTVEVEQFTVEVEFSLWRWNNPPWRWNFHRGGGIAHYYQLCAEAVREFNQEDVFGK